MKAAGGIKGRINSFQTLGALDGPGVRFVVFMQGCPLRCVYCHNPETWDIGAGFEAEPAEVLSMALRYKGYFGDAGGVTLSGGEPLLQAKFAFELFSRCKEHGINTALDTSGCILNEDVKKLLSVCDLVLLDIKWDTESEYKGKSGGQLSTVAGFLDELERRDIDTEIRRVIVPGQNDNEESIKKLAKIIKGKRCVKKVQLLPFKKLCNEKYDELGLAFPLKDTPQADQANVIKLQSLLENEIFC